MTGTVTADREAVLSLTVLNSQGQKQTMTAVIDTGTGRGYENLRHSWGVLADAPTVAARSRPFVVQRTFLLPGVLILPALSEERLLDRNSVDGGVLTLTARAETKTARA